MRPAAGLGCRLRWPDTTDSLSAQPRYVDVDALRTRSSRRVLRDAITGQKPCPRRGGRCSCRTERGNLHCPLPDHLDRNPSCSVTAGRPALWHCHSCGVGGDLVTLLELTDGLTRGKALELAAHMVGVETKARSWKPRRRIRLEVPPWHTEPKLDPLATALPGRHGPSLALWSAATAVDDTPAATYLGSRRVWPTELAAPSLDLIRWIPTELWKQLVPPPWEGGAPHPPNGCVGALLWPLWDEGWMVGVGAEGLDPEGRRRGPDSRRGCALGRWRRTIGVGGLWGTRIRDTGPALVVEGALDGLTALRVATLGVDQTLERCRPLWNQSALSGWVDTLLQVAAAGVVIASGGTARMLEAVAAAGRRRARVVIVTDADQPGVAAAVNAATAVRAEGHVQVDVVRPWAVSGTPEDLAAAAERWPWLTEHVCDDNTRGAPT